MDSSSTSGKILLVGVLVCGVVSVIAIIIGAAALTKTQYKPSGQGAQGGATVIQVQQGSKKPDRIFTIAHGHDTHSNEFIDTAGRVGGFNLDLIRAVCRKGGMKCQTIWEPYTNCWDSKAGQHPYVGPGLNGKWYDACTGWVVTVGRNQSVGFTDSYLKTGPAWFYTKPGTSFNQNDMAGIRQPIGFLDGWFCDEKCLARQTAIRNNKLPKSKIKHFLTTKEMQTAILDGSLAAAFGPEEEYRSAVLSGKLIRLGQTNSVGTPKGYKCDIRGNSMMTRKDNVEFRDKWNSAFRKLVNDGEFKKLCAYAVQNYKQYGTTSCIDM